MTLDKRNSIFVITFCAPALLVFTVFFFLPVLSSFYYSLFEWNGFGPLKMETYIGLRNYKDILHDEVFIKAIVNTLTYAVIVSLFQNFCGFILALMLDRGLKFKNALRAIFFMPAMLSAVVVGFTWAFILDPNIGAVNTVLRDLRMGFLAKNWLGDPNLAMFSIIVVSIWQWSGWYMIVYLAGLQGIPKELYEASCIDGATGFKQLLYITIPQIAPAITIGFVIATIGTLRVFDIIYVTTHGGPGIATEVITTQIYYRAFSANMNGYSTAMSVVLFMMVFIIGLLQIKFFKKREEVY